MTLTAYIIDDEPHAVELLSRYINATSELILLGSSLDAYEALAVFEAPEPPMLALIDIDLPGLSGLELADRCREETSVVFTTSSREYGPEAFEKNAADYLLKPFSQERFLQAVDKVRKGFEARQATSRAALMVPAATRGKQLRVLLDDMVLIEGDNNFIKVHLASETIDVYMTLQEMMEALPAARFTRVHKSFVVNLDHVVSLTKGAVKMDNQMILPIGRTFNISFRDIMRRRSL